MRVPSVVIVLLAARAMADCSTPGTSCLAGGGPASTDCFIAWSGIPAMAASCADGDACDSDGKADGRCTFALEACVNVAGLPGCTPAGLTGVTVQPGGSPVGQQLQSALHAISLTGDACTAPGISVPLKVSLAGIKPATVRLAVTATATTGKRDRDKLKLVCTPPSTPPSFAQIQDIFTRRCVNTGCHDSITHAENQDLSAGVAYSDSVGVKALEDPKLDRVKPGSIKGSFLAHKILGQGIPFGTGGGIMPQGCPNVPLNAGGCLTDDEKFAILAWIALGAPAQ
jgi:hypothetical protein